MAGWKSISAGLLILLAAASAGAPAKARPDSDSFEFYRALPAEIARPPGTLIRYKPMALPPFFRAKAWKIVYATRDYAGRPIAASGMVVLSTYAPKDFAARNIVAWAHPTTGVARQCAPSLKAKPTNTIGGFNDLITSGHIIAATDYPGLGTTGPVGYLVGKGQGSAVIDSVRAARQIPGVGGGNRYALWGYSQGAHAAMFAAGMTKSYAPELKLVGVAAAGVPTNLTDLLHSTVGTLEGRILASMTLHSWATKYGAPLGPLVDASTAKVVDHVAINCIDDLAGQLDVLAAQKPLAKKFLKADPAQVVPWGNLLWQNSITQLPPGVPALITQGGSDNLVRAAITVQFIRGSCRTNNPVKFVTLKGVDHTGTKKASERQAVAWINDRFRGVPAPSNCR